MGEISHFTLPWQQNHYEILQRNPEKMECIYPLSVGFETTDKPFQAPRYTKTICILLSGSSDEMLGT